MNDPQGDPSHLDEMANRLERLEQLALATNMPSRNWRDNGAFYQGGRFDRAVRQAARPVRRHPGTNPWLFVMVTTLNTMVAAVLAVIITLGVVRQEQRSDSQSASNASSGFAPEVTQAMAATQPIAIRPIGSPDQPLRLEAQRPARFPLQIQPEEAAAREPFILALHGLPTGAVLSGATRIGSDTWFLPPYSVNQLEITVPEWFSSVFDVILELRRTNGQVAAKAQAWIAVPPRQTAEATAATDGNAVKELIAQGDRLLEKGEVVAARAAYRRAAEMGSGPAALTLGSTYDPNRLWSIGAIGMVGSKERARQWYARADELGHPDAKERLSSLGN